MLISNGAIYKDEDGEPFILVDSKNASCEVSEIIKCLKK